MYILLCGYFLFFSGSLLIEAVASKWYSVAAAEIDQESFLSDICTVFRASSV